MEQLDKYIENKMQEQKQELNSYIDSKVEEKIQNKISRLNLEYETKQKNVKYEAETDGLVYLESNAMPHSAEIKVYDTNSNYLYGEQIYLSSAAVDSKHVVYVQKGCKWEAKADGGGCKIKWFKFE